MTVLVWISTALAGGIGAVLRFLVDGRVSARLKGAIPYGTLVVNLSGAAVLGVLTGAALNPDLALIIGTGAIGGYTTFSTWMFEAQRLSEDRHLARSLASVVVGLVAGLVSVAIGYALGRAL